ncbi:MAG TPA: DUF5103 domain-containing protein [Flavobacteriales bacterium]
MMLRSSFPRRHSLFALVLLTSCTGVQPVSAGDYWPPPTEPQSIDRTYSPTVHTVQLFKRGFEMSPPVLELGGGEPLVLRFDDLQSNTEYLSYTYVHCDRNWQPSDLSPAQYIQGAPTDVLPPPNQSFNTLQFYLQYEVEVPNEMMQPKLSGNYLLKVYRGSDQEDLILTRRFLVIEQRVQIDARMVATRDVDRRDVDQQIDLTIRHPGVTVRDPFSDLHVVMLQNFRWDDARSGFRPKFIRDNELVYDYPKEGLFAGGNEWRFFDMKNTRYSTAQMARITTSPEGLEEGFLLPDEKREFKMYFDLPDINGKQLVRNDIADGDPLGADYIYMNFVLPRTEPLSDEVYVYGGFSDMQCRPEFKCTWDPKLRAYTLRALMKQGYVNYAYAVLSRGSAIPDLAQLEGSHFQTENDYLVLVYLTDYQLRCDRLVGARFLNSRRG